MERHGVELEGKNVIIYFDDLSKNTVGRKAGTVIKDTPFKIFMKNSKGYLEIIPYFRIIRIIETSGIENWM